MNTLSDWLKHIESFHPEDIELGLERVKMIAERMGLLSFESKTIIVGGTNGKGSCVATLESLALESGLNVASYTSPHLVYFNERIKLNGLSVSDPELIRAFEAIELARDELPLTFFEFTTLAALFTFKQKTLDLIILEVGLGGRLDAVNIVEPDVSVITTIDKDHEAWLGSELEQIAIEKSGIYRQNSFNLIGDLRSEALLSKCLPPQYFKIVRASDICSELVLNKHLTTYLDDVSVNPFRLLRQNIESAIAAFNHLFPKVFASLSIKKVISNIKISGRFEKFSDKPLTYLDVGHNVQAAKNLVNQIKQLNSNGPIVAICGLMADKALSDFISVLTEAVDQWVFVNLPSERAASAGHLYDVFQSLDSSGTASVAESVKLGYQQLSQSSPPNTVVFALGSFVTVSEMLQYSRESW